MGAYIRGMEMPKSCSDCPMLDWDLDYIKCKVTGRHFKVKEEPFGARRVDDCPLIPVPEPHGRLIDADAALKNIKPINPKDQWTGCTIETTKRLMMSLINRAPTVIPASEEEE